MAALTKAPMVVIEAMEVEVLRITRAVMTDKGKLLGSSLLDHSVLLPESLVEEVPLRISMEDGEISGREMTYILTDHAEDALKHVGEGRFELWFDDGVPFLSFEHDHDADLFVLMVGIAAMPNSHSSQSSIVR